MILYFLLLAAAVRGILSMSKQCTSCNVYISSGESGIFTERGGGNKCWHPQCFTCHFCREQLVDNVYFLRNGHVYCGRHYSESIKPRCGGCDEVILNDNFELIKITNKKQMVRVIEMFQF